MDAFYRAAATQSYEETLATFLRAGASRREAEDRARQLHRCDVWKNDTYQVLIDHTPPHGFGSDYVIWHLSIRRLDREAIHDWRDLQQIKNDLCGREVEGVELYPAESRIVDAANQYHMHVVMHPAGFRFPFGFFTQAAARSGPEKAAKYGAKQREL